jgi:hypothetical protein
VVQIVRDGDLITVASGTKIALTIPSAMQEDAGFDG